MRIVADAAEPVVRRLLDAVPSLHELEVQRAGSPTPSSKSPAKNQPGPARRPRMSAMAAVDSTRLAQPAEAKFEFLRMLREPAYSRR